MEKSPEITASELVLSAVFFLQQKNGVSASEITKFVCDKRKCKAENVKTKVKKALDRAIKNGIFTKKRGLYRIETGFAEKLNLKKKYKEGSSERKERATKARSIATVKNMKLNYQVEGNGTSKTVEGGMDEKKLGYQNLEIHPNQKWSRLSIGESKNIIKSSLASLEEEFKKDNEDFGTSEDDDDDDDNDIDFFADESSPKNAIRDTSPFRDDNYESENNDDDMREAKGKWEFMQYNRFDEIDDNDEEKEADDDGVEYKNIPQEGFQNVQDASNDLDNWSKDATDSDNYFDSGDDSKGSRETLQGSNYEKSDINDSDTDIEKLCNMNSVRDIQNFGAEYRKEKRERGPQKTEKESNKFKNYEEDLQEEESEESAQLILQDEDGTNVHQDLERKNIHSQQKSFRGNSYGRTQAQTLHVPTDEEKMLKDGERYSRASKREAQFRTGKRKDKSKEKNDAPAKRERRK